MYSHSLKSDKLPGISPDTEGRGYRDEANTVQFGNVEKSRHRRSLPSPKRFAQAGRHFAVLTYSMYAPRVKMAAALLDGLF
jgi:hypothetical protein